MAFSFHIIGAEAQVLDAVKPDGSVAKILLLIDPATGFQVHADFSPAEAAKVAEDMSAPPKDQ